MSFIEQIGGLLPQYASGNGAQTREEAHAHYDEIARVVPQNVIGSVIGPALSSLGRDQVFRNACRTPATEMSASQCGQFMQTLLSGLSGSDGNLSSVLSQLGINQQIQADPQQATPTDVATLATHVR